MSNIKLGEIYGYDVRGINPNSSGIYAVRAMRMANNNPFVECKSLRTGRMILCEKDELLDYEQCCEVLEQWKNMKFKSAAAQDKSLASISRLEEIIREFPPQATPTQKQAALTLLSWLNDKVSVTKDDIAALDELTNLCLDTNNKELFEKVASLKNRLAACV